MSPLHENSNKKSSENIEKPNGKNTNVDVASTSQYPLEEQINDCESQVVDSSDMTFSLYGIPANRLELHKMLITENGGEYVLDKEELPLATHCLLLMTILGDENNEHFKSLLDKDTILLEEQWIFDSKERLQTIEKYIF